jgi:hypothetical protein
MLSQLDDCRRKFYWFYRGLDYAHTPAYFTFGKAWEVALDTWYSPQVDATWSPEQIDAHKERALLAAKAKWDEDGTIGSRNDTWENLEKLFGLYVETYPTDPFKVIGMEKGWEFPLQGTPYWLAGSLDGYADWQPYGGLIVENKTFGGYMNDQYIRQWNFSGQVTNYIWFGTQIRGDELFGCLMNMGSKKIPVKKEPDNLFARDLQKRTPFELEEFIEGILQTFEEFKLEWERWTWKKTGNQVQCVGGMGRSACLFQPLCSLDCKPGEVPDPTSFEGITWRKEKWEPWKRG